MLETSVSAENKSAHLSEDDNYQLSLQMADHHMARGEVAAAIFHLEKAVFRGDQILRTLDEGGPEAQAAASGIDVVRQRAADLMATRARRSTVDSDADAGDGDNDDNDDDDDGDGDDDGGAAAGSLPGRQVNVPDTDVDVGAGSTAVLVNAAMGGSVAPTATMGDMRAANPVSSPSGGSGLFGSLFSSLARRVTGVASPGSGGGGGGGGNTVGPHGTGAVRPPVARPDPSPGCRTCETLTRLLNHAASSESAARDCVSALRAELDARVAEHARLKRRYARVSQERRELSLACERLEHTARAAQAREARAIASQQVPAAAAAAAGGINHHHHNRAGDGVSNNGAKVEELSRMLREARAEIDQLRSRRDAEALVLEASIGGKESKDGARAQDAERKAQEAEAKLTDTQAKLTDTQAKLTDSQAKLTDTQTQLTDTQTQLTGTQAQLTDMESRLSKATEEIASLKEGLESASSRVKALEGEAKIQEERHARDVERLEADHAKDRSELAQSRKCIDKLEADLGSATARCKALQDHMALEEAAAAQASKVDQKENAQQQDDSSGHGSTTTSTAGHPPRGPSAPSAKESLASVVPTSSLSGSTMSDSAMSTSGFGSTSTTGGRSRRRTAGRPVKVVKVVPPTSGSVLSQSTSSSGDTAGGDAATNDSNSAGNSNSASEDADSKSSKEEDNEAQQKQQQQQAAAKSILGHSSLGDSADSAMFVSALEEPNPGKTR